MKDAKKEKQTPKDELATGWTKGVFLMQLPEQQSQYDWGLNYFLPMIGSEVQGSTKNKVKRTKNHIEIGFRSDGVVVWKEVEEK